MLFLSQPACKIYGTEFLSMFIQQHDGIRRLYLLQDQFALFLFLLVF